MHQKFKPTWKCRPWEDVSCGFCAKRKKERKKEIKKEKKKEEKKDRKKERKKDRKI